MDGSKREIHQEAQRSQFIAKGHQEIAWNWNGHLGKVTPNPELPSRCFPGEVGRIKRLQPHLILRAPDSVNLGQTWTRKAPFHNIAFGTEKPRTGEGYTKSQQRPFRQVCTEAVTASPWRSPCIRFTGAPLTQLSPVWEWSRARGQQALSHGGTAVSGKLFVLFILS